MAESKKRKEKEDGSGFGINLDDMAKAGLQFGHRISKIHPKMSLYISGVKNTIHLIDIEKSAEEFKKTLKFIQRLVSENKTIVLVGTKVQLKQLVKEFAEECGLPYVNERWLGGTITNFVTIKKRIDYFKDLEERKRKGELEKYTKKEREKINESLRKFEIKFGGIKNLENLPDAVFVLDMRKDFLAIREAKRKKIPVIGIADTNVDPELADYVIPANDDAISSIKYILGKVKEVILKKAK
jgi:small subunit ribosomal protein S2